MNLAHLYLAMAVIAIVIWIGSAIYFHVKAEQ